MIGDSFASGAAVETALRVSPISLYMIDEIGHLFNTLRGDSPSYVSDMVPVFLTLYGESSSFHKCRTYADSVRNQEDVIEGPCLSIYGTSVPGNFYGSITREQISNGLLSRFLVFESEDPDPFEQRTGDSMRNPPERLEAWCRRWIDDVGVGGNLKTVPRAVVASGAAWAVFESMETKLRAKRAEMRAAGDDQGPYTRAKAMAMKLALIRACGIKDVPEVTEDDARWGVDLAWLLVCKFADKVLGRVADSKAEGDVRKVLDVVVAGGKDGVSKAQLTRKTQWLARQARGEHIATLIESGQIREVKVDPEKQTGQKRQITRYIAI